MTKNIKLVTFLIAGTVGLMGTQAQAGGLFGDGGIIRGSVGNFLDRTIEKPITTPLARGAVEAGGTVLGCKFGGPLGCAAGHSAGQAINGAFAGGHGGGAAPQPVPQPHYAPVSQQYGAPFPQYAPQPMAVGNVCVTAAGRSGPGNLAPIGSPCQWASPMGLIPGAIGL